MLRGHNANFRYLRSVYEAFYQIGPWPHTDHYLRQLTREAGDVEGAVTLMRESHQAEPPAMSFNPSNQPFVFAAHPSAQASPAQLDPASILYENNYVSTLPDGGRVPVGHWYANGRIMRWCDGDPAPVCAWLWEE